MKRNKSKKRGSFFTLLVRNYIVFTIAIGLAIVSLVTISSIRVAQILKEPKVKDVVDYASLLSTEQYGEIPIEYLMGKGSYIKVLDKDNKIVYESDPKKFGDNLTKGEVECIQNYAPYGETYVEEYYNDKGEKNTSITIYYNEEYEKKDKIYIVDKDLNLIYTNTKTKKKSFTKREFEYLTGEYPQGYDIKKYNFHDKNNNDLMLIMYVPTFREETMKKIDRITIITLIGFAIIYIILITIFIIWMNRKVKRPVNLLNKAIVNFKNGEREKYLNYDGPQEFYDICESFNDMSRQLYESEKKSEKLEEDKQKMLADISHDLKTPITVIKGYSKVVCDNLVCEEEKNQYLMTIYKKADNLDQLINTFYEYSKMEHPEYKLTLEKLDICEYTRAYLAEKYDELYISGVELEADIPEEPIYCNIDKVQLKRVFENIVSNTLKHNNEGISILFEVEILEDKVKIIIADNGCGIPKDIAKSIFEPFVVGQKSRTKQGSGLGLAISKKIIEGHEGSIKLISSRDNYKTLFEISLPIKIEK